MPNRNTAISFVNKLFPTLVLGASLLPKRYCTVLYRLIHFPIIILLDLGTQRHCVL